MRLRALRTGLLVVAMSCAVGLGVLAQEPGAQAAGAQAGRRQFGGMQRVAGTVTAVSGDAITVKAEDGTVYQVTTTANTRLMKGGGVTFKVADLKAGDGVLAMGNMDAPNKTLHAALVGATDAEQLKKMRENLGKTYIAGRVTAIDPDNLKITVQRQDGVSQTIGLDETTSFKRGGRVGRGGMGGMMAGMGPGGAVGAPAAAGAAPTEGGESITLADVKVGDNVMGPGSIKNGVFVPEQLNVARPQRQGRRPGAAGGPEGPGGAGPGGASAPASPPAGPQ